MPRIAHNRLDLTGQRFGLLVAIEPCGLVGQKVKWRCRCDCGATHEAQGSHLRRGLITNCGCFKTQRFTEQATKHGHFYHPMHQTWVDMLKRCENPRDRSFKNYGARGIKVCERWASSFDAFVADMGPKPYGMALDRIDNDGSYEPGNCRWVTHEKNCNNTIRSVLLEFDGRKQTLTEWARERGINESTLYYRVRRRGWSLERALAR